ncbi:hypothetical protein Dsin_016247 [Dipteronia sinensis]|uniref:RNase H type-1 domain-containing protein n=1 Tax=Dipteronia sinensis TaxID=43782 RepID=A0AAE0ACQ7_9ROSI|nr:hypothetical protein Dsin_016247 [Dipteronia sinensis]
MGFWSEDEFEDEIALFLDENDGPILNLLGVHPQLHKSPKIVSYYWVPPLAPWIKVNTDGSSKGNPGLGSCSSVYRDSSARFIGAFGAPLGICDSFFVKMKVALLAINFALRYGWRWIWLETDS